MCLGACSHPLDCPAPTADELGHPVNPQPLRRAAPESSFDLGTDPGGRPQLQPSALARRRPALTRSTIMARSNSAKTPDIWNSIRP